jgi:hypothetical protein
VTEGHSLPEVQKGRDKSMHRKKISKDHLQTGEYRGRGELGHKRKQLVRDTHSLENMDRGTDQDIKKR